jgi:hypothetical protein
MMMMMMVSSIVVVLAQRSVAIRKRKNCSQAWVVRMTELQLDDLVLFLFIDYTRPRFQIRSVQSVRHAHEGSRSLPKSRNSRRDLAR